MNRVLEISSVKKTFSHKNGESSHVLKDFDLKVEENKITALIGGNGSGKTTLFNIISGLIAPDSGELYFYNGKRTDLRKMTPDGIARSGIGRMFQDNHIFKGLSVIENLLIAHNDTFGELPFISLIKPTEYEVRESKRLEQAKEVLKLLFSDNKSFLKMTDEKAGNLSYGQQRLLGLARLFMQDYKLILLDEPTTGVNPNLISKISEIIKMLVSENKVTVFLIEHNMKFVKDNADICAFLNDGQVSQIGMPSEVINNPFVRKIYLGTE